MNEVVTKEDIKIENMIYEIRGKQVMLDSDLARLYLKSFQNVLNDSEMEDLRSKILTSSLNKHGDRRYNISFFTEQGVAMLATVLNTKVATEVSIRIMDAFISMRKSISSNLLEQKYINDLALEHDKRIKALENLTNKIKKIEED